MSSDWSNLSSLTPPDNPRAPPTLISSEAPPLLHWETPSFTVAAGFRVGATFVLFVLAACSNLSLLVSLCCGRGRRLANHLRPLMLSLLSADLMMTFVLLPLDAVWNVTVQWLAGDAACATLSFLRLFALQSSASVLVVISLDRHHAILRPLHVLHAQRRNERMLLLAWSFSLLFALPQLVLFRTVHVDMEEFIQCASHGSFRHRWQETVYNMFHFFTLYVLPLLVMSCCYSHILLHIHQQHLRNQAGVSVLRRSGADVLPKARMKTLKMAVLMVLSFVVCWTPYYLLGIWYWFQPSMLSLTPDYVHHAVFLFGNLNTCCDPLIYGLYTPSFRTDLARFCCRHKSHASEGSLSADRQTERQTTEPPNRRNQWCPLTTDLLWTHSVQPTRGVVPDRGPGQQTTDFSSYRPHSACSLMRSQQCSSLTT